MVARDAEALSVVPVIHAARVTPSLFVENAFFAPNASAGNTAASTPCMWVFFVVRLAPEVGLQLHSAALAEAEEEPAFLEEEA